MSTTIKPAGHGGTLTVSLTQEAPITENIFLIVVALSCFLLLSRPMIKTTVAERTSKHTIIQLSAQQVTGELKQTVYVFSAVSELRVATTAGVMLSYYSAADRAGLYLCVWRLLSPRGSFA